MSTHSALSAWFPMSADPFSGHLFIFRGWRDDRVDFLWADGDGMSLLAKRLERSRFVWLLTMKPCFAERLTTEPGPIGRKRGEGPFQAQSE